MDETKVMNYGVEEKDVVNLEAFKVKLDALCAEHNVAIMAAVADGEVYGSMMMMKETTSETILGLLHLMMDSAFTVVSENEGVEVQSVAYAFINSAFGPDEDDDPENNTTH